MKDAAFYDKRRLIVNKYARRRRSGRLFIKGGNSGLRAALIGGEMEWEPLSETELWDLINTAYDQMDLSQRRLWEIIRIRPEKWVQHPYGDSGGGFWALAIIGSTVVWYNDI